MKEQEEYTDIEGQRVHKDAGTFFKSQTDFEKAHDALGKKLRKATLADVYKQTGGKPPAVSTKAEK